jgi:hemolysin activation/secretion protein
MWALFGSLLISAWAVSAAPLPPAPSDPFSQERLLQQERERVLRKQHEPSPDVRLEQPGSRLATRLPVEETPCFPIHRIELIGDSANRFQWSLKAADPDADPATGRCLGTAGINLTMKRIQDAIIGRGYVTSRVLAKPQDLKSGTLVLTLIPGRIHRIRFADGTSGRATQWNAVPASPGDLLNLRDIEQALENFKRVPTADADIRIMPAEGAGAQPGESDLVITWRQGTPLRLNISVDDAGNKATGRYQGTATLSYDNWWTLNDLFYVSYGNDLGGGGHGTRNQTAHYSLPLGYWLLGFTASANNYYQSVAGASQTYRYSGKSQNDEIELARTVYRDASRKTTVSLAGWLETTNNYIDDTEVLVQRRRMAGWTLGIAHKEFIGKATLDLELDYRNGTGAMGSLPAPEEAFGEGTSRPRLLQGNLHLDLPFVVGRQQWRYLGVIRTQWNDTPLVPLDRFAIGGRYTVRGFDGENILSADRGWLIRNDLGLALGQTGQELYLGLDHGEVAGPSSTLLVGMQLTGAVLGLRGNLKNLSYDLFAGWPLQKPDGFVTASQTFGFNLNASF